MFIKDKHLQSIYPELLSYLQDSGRPSQPRGQAVIESTLPVMWTVEQPDQWALFIPGRKFNPFFALAEVVWMWSGKGGYEFISYYNKSIGQFLDSGLPYFHGSYGRRVREAGYDEHPFRAIPAPRTQGANSMNVTVDQLEHVIGKIQRDSDTRQAVVVLWDPLKDNLVSSKDHPCNNVLYFQNREGALDMTVIRRSNDLIWGVPYNSCQFAHLQGLMAGSLGLKMGSQTTVANNLHYYKDLYVDTLNVVQDWEMDRTIWPGGAASQLEMMHAVGVGMTSWTLFEFTNFVTQVWDVFEKKLRLIESEVHGDALHSQLWMQKTLLEAQFDSHAVPGYWQLVFYMLLAYHYRKAKFVHGYDDLMALMPKHYRWLAQDMDGGH